MFFNGFWHLYNEILTSLITLLDNVRYPYHPFTVSENSKCQNRKIAVVLLSAKLGGTSV